MCLLERELRCLPYSEAFARSFNKLEAIEAHTNLVMMVVGCDVVVMVGGR